MKLALTATIFTTLTLGACPRIRDSVAQSSARRRAQLGLGTGKFGEQVPIGVKGAIGGGF